MRDELTITALGIDAVERARKERQDKTASSAKSSEQSIGLMEPDLRKHILALLELGIKHSDHGGLNQTRLSELENRLGLSRDVMRAAIKYLGERGLARLIVENPMLPYGVSQAFVTDTGKLYYHQLLEQPGQKIEKTVPIEIQESLPIFRKDYPDSSKICFIMMKFGETPAHDRIVKTIKETLTSHGLGGVRSDDKQYHDDLLPNVLTYVYGCGFGVAVFERIEAEQFNPNVSLEVGYMLALGKEVCLLKDKTLRTLQTDLLGKHYRQFDAQDPEQTIPNELSRWLSDKGILGDSRRDIARISQS
jgi:hypothetical protein